MTATERAERIYLARRGAIFRRLVDAEHMDELDAEHWIARWERQAEEQRVGRFAPEFWQEGDAWIAENRQQR